MYLLPLDQHLPWHQGAIAAAKAAIYDGFRRGVAALDLDHAETGIIADDATAAPFLRDADAHGHVAISTLGPNVDQSDARNWKVVVRYNPEGDARLNDAQAARARRVSAMLRVGPSPHGRLLICDLVIPPTQRQIAGGIRTYDSVLLADLTRRAITELVDNGVDPDAWVIEGLERQSDYATVVAAAARGSRPACCLVRAAGYGERTTAERMSTALEVPGVVGVVFPQAPFWEAASAWMCGYTSRATVVAAVAAEFERWVEGVTRCRREVLRQAR